MVDREVVGASERLNDDAIERANGTQSPGGAGARYDPHISGRVDAYGHRVRAIGTLDHHGRSNFGCGQ